MPASSEASRHNHVRQGPGASPRDPALHLQRLTAIALTLVAALSVWSYVLFEGGLQTAAGDAPTLSAAGGQRQLTQQLTNLAFEIHVARSQGQFAFRTGDLRMVYRSWSSIHQGLQQGDAELRLPPNYDPRVAAEFAVITPDYEAISQATTHLLDAMFTTSGEGVAEDVQTIMEHADSFAEGMDRIAALYQADAEARVRKLKRVVLTLTVLTLVVLLLEGLLVFRPAARLIRRQFREQQALSEEARKLALVASRTDNAVVITDAEGRSEWVNEAFERLTGRTFEEMRGTVPEFMIKDTQLDAQALGELTSRLLGGQSVRAELRHTRGDGTHYWGDLEALPVLDEHGSLRHFITIERDITDAKQAQEAIRRYTEDLAVARDEALASARAKSEFLANMSHEIRTPMNGVIGMVSLLLQTPLSEEQRDYALTVRQSAEALLTVINDILDFSKIEAGKLTLEAADFNLRTVLEEVSDLLAPRAHEKQLEFACVVPADLPEALRGDAARLRQMVINLLGNAIKFTDAGEVVLEAKVLRQTSEDVRLQIGIRDTGIGIPKDRQQAIFESFTQADGATTRRFGGTGLGLTISRQLAELMGGCISLESEPGRGSTFAIEVPFRKGIPPAPRRRRAGLEGLRVLVVDDHAVNRRALHGQLRAWGMRSAEVSSGHEALQVLRAALESDPFALALLDMQMPEMDGEQTAAAIKADPTIAHVPLVLLSSAGLRFSSEEMSTRGFAAALTKPARASRLFDTLVNVLGTPEPETPPAPDMPRRGAAPSGPEAALGLRVLLAEDNAINQKVACRMLERLGCEVKVVADGGEAVGAWEQATYDVILMDVQMPVMDGWQATAEIRRREAGRDRRTPIIALTAHAMAGDEQRCLAAGMDAYVAKPFNPAQLRAALAKSSGGGARPPESPASTEAGDVLDASRLQELCGTDTQFRREILQDFLDLAPRLLANIDAAIAEGDGGTLAGASHSLKGSSRTLGAVALGAVCEQLEGLGRSGALDAARDTLARAQEEFARLRSALGLYLPTEA